MHCMAMRLNNIPGSQSSIGGGCGFINQRTAAARIYDVERPSPAPSIKAHSVHIFFVFVPEKNKWAPAVSRGSPPLKNLSPRIEGLQAATDDPLQKLTLVEFVRS